MRLVPNHSRQIRRAELVTFFVDGQPFLGHLGERVAVALLRAGHLTLRNAPSGGGARGMFCCMGLCQECMVEVAGMVTESCQLEVQDGLRICTHGGQP